MRFTWVLRLKALYPHGGLSATLYIHLEVANKFLFSDVFKICVELHDIGAFKIISTLFIESQRCAGSLVSQAGQ